MDPSQDLIVILQRNTWEPEVICRIHFRTLSNDVPHPLAPHTLKFSIITKEPNSDINSICDPVLSIADNILMLKFHVGDGLHGQKELRVMIWDWKSAEPKMDVPTFSDFTVPSFPANSSLGLLNPSYFFVTSMSGNGSIQLYRIAKYSPIHVATLNFPTILRFTRIFRLYAHSGPIEARRKPNSTFLMCDDDRLHVLVIHYFYEDHEKDIAIPVNLYVHQRVLMKYCVQETRSDGKHLDVPWEDWGPPNTRLTITSFYRSPHFRFVHGQRAICSTEDEIPLILDFSLATILSVTGVLPSTSSSTTKEWVVQPSVKILKSQVPLYQDEVETRLPCVFRKIPFTGDYSDLMIHAGGFVKISRAEEFSFYGF